jgi:anti-sigma regulatory factor (Ser/Thr protein kinase)
MSSTTMSVPAEASSVALAREIVSDFLGDVISPQFVADAQLLTSELVSNSISHEGLAVSDEIGLDLDLSERRLRVAVSDAGPGFETPPQLVGGGGLVVADRGGWGLVVTHPSGWGLVVVDRVSDRWGINSNQPSVMWFELDRS